MAVAVAFGSRREQSPSAGSLARTTAVTQHHDHKHAGASGHLPATRSNVELVSTLALRSGPRKRIADVGFFRGHAYLGSWGGCTGNGVHVVDLRDPERPKKVAFVASPPGSVPGEGVQALRIETPAFRGDVLVTNNETCDRTKRLGGMNLYDVSNPRRPKLLVRGFGDRTTPDGARQDTAHETHSVFAWDAGRRAYAVLVDNFGQDDVDIVDVTNPRKPVLIAEYDLRKRFPQILQPRETGLLDVFHHDVVVKRVGSRYVMVVSYWDGGHVLLDVTNPHKARYLADSDFTSPDVELARQAGLREPAEGNAHQAELTKDADFLIAADEDLSPSRLDGALARGRSFTPAPGSATPPLAAGKRLEGIARFDGRACEGDVPVPAASGATFAVVVRGTCVFTEKLARVEAKGYEAAIVVNSEGIAADACGTFRMRVDGGIPAFSVARSVGYQLFDLPGYDRASCRAGERELLPGLAVGRESERVTVRSTFDGWGYVHLFRNGTGKLRQLDTYAIPEAMDPGSAAGRGILSVHEVATSLQRNDLAYLSYYAGGLRVIRIERNEIVEAGRFVDVNGNNLWGVQAFVHRGREYVAASDIDFGLYVFRYTGE